MSGTLRSLTGACLMLLMVVPSARASVVKGENGETFIDPLFAEEATCQTEFSLRVNLDRFATSYDVVRLRMQSNGEPRTYVDRDGVRRFDWVENEVTRPLQAVLEVAAEYALVDWFSIELRVPMVMSGDRDFRGGVKHQPRVISRYHNIADDPVPGDDRIGALAIEQDEYTDGFQTDPIWITPKFTIYAARGENYSNALSFGMGIGFLAWGQRLPRYYYVAHQEERPYEDPESGDTNEVEVKWYDYRDSNQLILRPHLAFQRSYGTWQVGGQVGVEIDIATDDTPRTTVDLLVAVNASYLLHEYLAAMLEFIGQADLFTSPALWGFAPSLRLILPFGDDPGASQLQAGLGVLLPVHDDSHTDPYNPVVRLTAGVEF